MDNWYYNEWRYNAEKIIINKNKDYFFKEYFKDYYYKLDDEGYYSISLKDQKISDSDCRTSSEDERQKALARLQQG